MTDAILEVFNLRKSFGPVLAVSDVSFSMKEGEIIGLLGPNGAGKTTVFYIIAGFLKPNSGSVRLNGVIINNLPMYRRAILGISYLPQELGLLMKGGRITIFGRAGRRAGWRMKGGTIRGREFGPEAADGVLGLD